ncbi:uncharacterized protein LOC109598447 [Aethina tumida]|uniref:uncharacterized protein LOC109598447 n=1 Tax=Aethina tumida TaxID=116153 RepID=UPI002147A854|nr:uncharacterized protein LOC109598447 [Aethina tumida]
MNPTKPKNYYGVIIITTSATLLALLALLDMLVNPDEKDAFVTLSVLVQIITKSIANFLYSNEFYQLSEDLKQFWSFENEEQYKDKFTKTLNVIHKGAKICFTYTYVAIILLVNISLFTSRSLPMYVYVPKMLGKNFIFIFECVTFPFIAINVIAFDYVIFTFLQLTIIQFKLLNSAINKLDVGNLEPQLMCIIKHHIFMLEFTAKLNGIMSMPLFFQVFNSIPSLCFEMYLLRTNVDFCYGVLAVLHSLLVLIQLAVYCLPCQEVINKGEEVAFNIYSIKWYELEDNSQKTILPIIIMRSQATIEFSAAGFVAIDRPALVMVFQTSLSFYSFLVAMDGENY